MDKKKRKCKKCGAVISKYDVTDYCVICINLKPIRRKLNKRNKK